jgi:hypothetical protein
MNPGVTEEVGKAAHTFMDVMREQPLSLALVVMNLLLLGFLWYSNSVQLTQRKDTVELIVAWQKESDKLLSNCVSKDIMEIVVKALDRDRELYRQLLPHPPAQPEAPKPQSEQWRNISLPVHAPFVFPP